MSITTDRLPPLTSPTTKNSWKIRKKQIGEQANDKERRVSLTNLQANDLLEIDNRSSDRQYAGADSSLDLSSQALLRGLDVVHRVGLQLQRRRSPGALAQEVIQILEDMIGYDNAAILLVDRSVRQLKPFALSERAYGKDFAQAYERYISTHELRLGVGVPGWVAHHGQSLLYGDISFEPRLENLETEMRSMLFVPILVEGVVVGTLGVESRLVDAFTPMDRQLLETIAGQLAIAIQNAHLFSRVRFKPINAEGTTKSSHLNGKYGTKPLVVEEEDEASVAAEQTEYAELAAADEETAPMPVLMIGKRKGDDDDTQALLADLRAQVEDLSAFNHTVAHDLKNPLSILMGFADVLVHDYAGREDELLDQGIRIIIENGRRIENIIDELLLLAEIRTVEQIPLMPLDMQAVLAVTNRRLSNFIKEYRPDIVVPETWPQAMGHQPWVEEIWVNYLSNAIKYGGSSPRVEVGGEPLDDGMVRFWVCDFGAGIDPADQKRLFVPFTKLQQADTKGHGLGLSIVQRIAKRLGGAVGVESEPGKGSLFWFTLPAVPQPPVGD